MEKKKRRKCVTQAGVAAHACSAIARVMEPLSMCRGGPVCTGDGLVSLGEECKMREAFLQGSPSVSLCFPLASSGSVCPTLWIRQAYRRAELQLLATLASLSCSSVWKPMFETKYKLHTRERVVEHLWNRASVGRRTHPLSLHQDAHPRTAWVYLQCRSTCDDLAFHSPPSPAACVLLRCNCCTPSASNFFFLIRNVNWIT